MMRGRLNPITRKRIQRFRQLRRAWWSLWILVGLYGLSLFANLISNDIPLVIRHEGRLYMPILRFQPESTFIEGGRDTRPHYKTLRTHPVFAEQPDNFMIFPPIPYSPHEIIPPSAIEIPDEIRVHIQLEPRIGSIDFNAEGRILRALNSAGFFDAPNDAALRAFQLVDLIDVSPDLEAAIEARFANRAAPRFVAPWPDPASVIDRELILSAWEPAPRPPRFLRITLQERASPDDPELAFRVGRDDDPGAQLLRDARFPLTAEQVAQLQDDIFRRFEQPVPDRMVDTPAGQLRVRYDKETVTYPFRPTRAHPLGLDSSGRDVLAQIIYALRTSMSFGLLLVIVTLAVGIVIGAIQGYLGGFVDIAGQRLIEIWSALPFLYIIILLGSVYGRSFMLLLICYGIFNWIGISYYIRAEFLKLRKQPFVEAARVMGLKKRSIIFRHILPNALVPVITFFPFSLVGAIGSLAALDYLGFGLPPTTPSWGALLAQAQEFRFAWWLVLSPSVALFIVILLGVFVGEGVRAAFDPRGESKWE